MLDALTRPVLLIALVTAAAGPWVILVLLRLAFRRSGLSSDLLGPTEHRVIRTGSTATWIALAAAVPELYMQAVDISGGSPLGGVELWSAWRLLTRTTVGRVWIARSVLLSGLWIVFATTLKRAHPTAAPSPRAAPR